MGSSDGRTPGAGTPGAKVNDDDDLNSEHRQHDTAFNGRAQGGNTAERLSKLFVGNNQRHVKNFGPPVWHEEKHKWKLQTTTDDGPATLAHWSQHLYRS